MGAANVWGGRNAPENAPSKQEPRGWEGWEGRDVQWGLREGSSNCNGGGRRGSLQGGSWGQTHIWGLSNFCLFGRCFRLVTLSNAGPLQDKRLVCLPNFGLLYRKNRATTLEVWKAYQMKGGPNPFAHCELFMPPLLPNPPWRPLTRIQKHQNHTHTHTPSLHELFQKFTRTSACFHAT